MNVTRLVPRTAPLAIERRGLRCLQVSAALWRVTRPDGAIVGYLESLDPDPVRDGQGVAPPVPLGPRPILDVAAEEARRAPDRVIAKRMTADRRGFIELGRFRDLDEAIDALGWDAGSARRPAGA